MVLLNPYRNDSWFVLILINNNEEEEIHIPTYVLRTSKCFIGLLFLYIRYTCCKFSTMINLTLYCITHAKKITIFGFKLLSPAFFELYGTNCQVSNNAKFLNATAMI